jgi:hypothetical protein
MTSQLLGAYAMDGQNRRRAVIKSLAIVVVMHGSFVLASDPENAKHRDVKMYMSPTLETEFLGAVSVDLRFEGPIVQPEKCKLKFSSHSNTSANGLKSNTVAITLKELPENARSVRGKASDQRGVTYAVLGLPSEILKSGCALQLKLAVEGGDEESAHLELCDSNGKASRRITLTLAQIPDEAEKIGAEKQQIH